MNSLTIIRGRDQFVKPRKLKMCSRYLSDFSTRQSLHSLFSALPKSKPATAINDFPTRTLKVSNDTAIVSLHNCKEILQLDNQSSQTAERTLTTGEVLITNTIDETIQTISQNNEPTKPPPKDESKVRKRQLMAPKLTVKKRKVSPAPRSQSSILSYFQESKK